MENIKTKLTTLLGKAKQKVGKIVQMGVLGALLATGTMEIGCGGGSGQAAAQPKPEPEPQKKPYLTVVQKQNATASHQSGERTTGETLTVTWTPDEDYTLDCPGHPVTMNGNQTVACDHTIEKIPDPDPDPEPEPDPDPYDTEFALRDALVEIWTEIGGRELTPQQQYEYGQRMEKAFIDGFARDAYAKHLPFDSKVLAKVFEYVDFRLPYTGGLWSDRRTYAQITTIGENTYAEALAGARTTIHEVGHCLGLGEALSNFIAYKNDERNMETIHNLDALSLTYSPFYPELLCNKVGDSTFWKKVYEGSDQEYGAMWDANMTVLDADGVRRPLVSYDSWLRVTNLSQCAAGKGGNVNYTTIATDFENFAGIRSAQRRFAEIRPLFVQALNGNKNAEREVKNFFEIIEKFNTAYQNVLDKNLGTNVANVFPNARIFDFFKVDTKTQGKVAQNGVEK